jgi:hypothetical protein
MYELSTTLIEYDQGTIKIAIVPDEDPPRPDDCDCEPEFFNASTGNELSRKLHSEFKSPDKAYTMMTRNPPYKSKDGDWYYGFSCYSHSGVAFALCATARARNFPDQRWDVIGLAGWIKVSKQNRKDWGIHGKPKVEEKALANAKASLEQWETYCNGWVVGYVVTVLDKDEKELDEKSCWGFYAQGDAEADAKATAEGMAERLGWTLDGETKKV